MSPQLLARLSEFRRSQATYDSTGALSYTPWWTDLLGLFLSLRAIERAWDWDESMDVLADLDLADAYEALCESTDVIVSTAVGPAADSCPSCANALREFDDDELPALTDDF